MTSDEIFRLAQKRSPAPEDMTLPEQMLYTIARNIYKAYDDKIITLEQARIEKRNAVREFDKISLSERCWADQIAINLELAPLTIAAEKNGCEVCRKMSRLIDRRLLPRMRGAKVWDI